jgi:MFS family permease
VIRTIEQVGPAAAPGRAAPSRLRTSLKASLLEGVLAELVGACSSSAVLTAWALYLRLPAAAVGVVGALPFAAQALHLPGAWAAAIFGNRNAAFWAVGLSRQVPLVLCALPFAPLPAAAKQAVLIGAATLSAGLAVAGNNAWTGWMGELVPRRIRGRYFGRRGAFCALGAAAGGLGAGLALDWGGAPGGGFDARAAGPALAALSLGGCLFGAATWALLARQHQPVDRRSAPRAPALADVLSPLRSDPARRLLAFQALWCASSGLSAAFYPLHMVQTLGMGFTQVALYNTALAAARMVAAPLFGRALDRRGAASVLQMAAFGLCLSPLLWMFPRTGMLWPLALDAALCGALLAAQSLSTFSLSLSLAEPRRGSFHVAAFAVAGGLSTGLGAAAGGLLYGRLPAQAHLLGLALGPSHLLFLVGDAGRLLAALLTLRIARAKASAVEPAPAPPAPLAPDGRRAA